MFSVEFYKATAKRSAPKRDGYLVVGTLESILFDDDSTKITHARTTAKHKEHQTDDRFVLNNYAGNLLDELPTTDYTSGMCFLNLMATVNKIDMKPKKLNMKDSDIVEPYAP